MIRWYRRWNKIKAKETVKWYKTARENWKIRIWKEKVNLTTCSGRIKRFAKTHGLKANDKESCSLILLMDMVEEGGASISVLKEGVFFNGVYKDLRRCLVEITM